MVGKLIVIEGSDGSGKATQAKLLLDRLQSEGVRAATMYFPQYEGNVFGKLIGECLAGGRGDFLSLDPRIASVLYAGDRFESKKQLEQLLEKNDVVVLDRYVSSNKIHQGGRIKDVADRSEFLKWVDHLEYELFGLPRPDLIIFLDVPTEISMKLAGETQGDEKKAYLNGKVDMYEASETYNKSSREHAMELLEKNIGWSRVECTDGGYLLPKKAIHESVYNIVSKITKL